MSLTSFLREAIDCYLHDADVAWTHIENASMEIMTLHPQSTIEENRHAEEASREITARALIDRFLESRDKSRVRVIAPASIASHESAPLPDDAALVWNSINGAVRRTRFENILEVLVWWINQDQRRSEQIFPDRTNVTKNDVERELTEEQIWRFEGCSDWGQIERQFDLERRRLPNYEAYLVRKHLDWIDVSVGKLENDELLSCRELLPDHIKDYLYIASWCNAYGLDAACAAICGGISEQALRAKYEERRVELAKRGIHIEKIGPKATFGTVIEYAAHPGKDLPVLSETAARKARKIDEARSEACHGSPSFFEKPTDVRKSVLALTSELLDTLFSPAT